MKAKLPEPQTETGETYPLPTPDNEQHSLKLALINHARRDSRGTVLAMSQITVERGIYVFKELSHAYHGIA